MSDVKYRVWLRKKDGQLGYAITDTFFGDIWFFGEMGDQEIIGPGEPFLFLDDKREEYGLHTREDFIDLGEL